MAYCSDGKDMWHCYGGTILCIQRWNQCGTPGTSCKKVHQNLEKDGCGHSREDCVNVSMMMKTVMLLAMVIMIVMRKLKTGGPCKQQHRKKQKENWQTTSPESQYCKEAPSHKEEMFILPRGSLSSQSPLAWHVHEKEWKNPISACRTPRSNGKAWQHYPR